MANASGTGTAMNVALLVVQGLLAVLFLWAGVIKLVLPLDQLTGPIPVPAGLILPGLLRIRPGQTPLAAAGLVIIMIGATGFGLAARDVMMTLIPLLVGLLAAFVAYGRWRLRPHRARTAPR